MAFRMFILQFEATVFHSMQMPGTYGRAFLSNILIPCDINTSPVSPDPELSVHLFHLVLVP